MGIKYLITTSVIITISASAVQAADVIVSRESVSVAPIITIPTFSWTGLYLGGQIGGFSSKTRMDVLDGDNTTSVHEVHLPELSGFVGGLYAGSNVDFGNGLVMGVDTDIIWANKEIKKLETTTIKTAVQIANTHYMLIDAGIKIKDGVEVGEGDRRTDGYSVKEKWTGATRVRIGFAADRFLPYVAGGIAYTQLRSVHTVSIAGKDENYQIIASGTVSDETKSLVGYTLGAGVDFAITDNVMVRAEYRYSDFGKKKFGKDKYEVSYKTNDFRVGVAYKF
ncbi:outer membrane protein [Bartonella sp. CB175]|uniref:outer membrane protein n=1 Tax=Bartonella sp. CB175 TaxID=3112256 RepID=UPI00300E5C71